MKEGDKILILPSCALKEMGLERLSGLQATISQVVKNGNAINGCWVELPRKYLHEIEWYIPYSSIGICN